MKLSGSIGCGLVLLLLSATVAYSEIEDVDDLDASDDTESTVLFDEDDLTGQAEGVPAEVPVFLEKPVYKPPKASGNTYLTESFESTSVLGDRWVKSEAVDQDSKKPKYDGEWSVEEAAENSLSGDLGLVLKDKAKHSAVSVKLDRPFEFGGHPFIVQYDVKFQNGQECGGAYIKLLAQDPGMDLKQLHDKTTYTIMFGPDKCGKDVKLHFIFQHKSPITGKFEEKHARKSSVKFEEAFTDKKTHLFTLVVNPDNTYEIFLDQASFTSGSLHKDMTPAVNPPEQIQDPTETKPLDWDDQEKIADPQSKKPDDWDETEPEEIPDADAVIPESWLEAEPVLIPNKESEKPSDWDDDVDGEWEAPLINNPICEGIAGCGPWSAPLIKNPLYRGKWIAPLITNPDYDGKWAPKMIPNPEYFDDKEPYRMTPIVALSLELWSISDGMFFDNFIVTDSKAVADQWAEDSWRLKRKHELGVLGRSVMDVFVDLYHEQPWLLVVIALGVVLPTIFFFVWCCRATEASDITSRKRTDFPTDDILSGEVNGDGDDEDKKPIIPKQSNARKNKSGRPTKGDLETKPVASAEVNDWSMSDTVDDVSMELVGAQAEADNEDEGDNEREESAPVKPATTTSSPRKRATRKE